MGIDFSHCDASWAYSGFNRARIKLAKEIGLDLNSMVGFGGEQKWPDHDLIPLLNHSDCDGELTPEECKRVAPALREAVSKWDDDYDRAKFLELAEGMELAASLNEALQFT